MKSPDNSEGSVWKELGPYMNIGIQMVLTILLGVWLGWQLDAYFKTKPVLLIIFSFLFSVTGLYSAIRTAMKSEEKKKD